MQRFIGKLLNSLWPSVLWTLLIFILLTIQIGPLERVPMLGIPHFDKFVHAFLFGMLVFFWWRYLSVRSELSPALKNVLFIFISATAFGIGMEFYQKYFTLREFELGDIYADTAGAAASAFICSFIKK
jgi:VanZ family protein